jgi:hypothetical protein
VGEYDESSYSKQLFFAFFIKEWLIYDMLHRNKIIWLNKYIESNVFVFLLNCEIFLKQCNK